MEFMLYPTFVFAEGRGFLPNIHLPTNYKELIPIFYRQGRRQEVEVYARIIEQRFLEGKLEIRLSWDEEVGLRNINIGPSGGLDLEEEGWPSFREHNLGTKTSIATGMVAMKYVSELLKSHT